MPKIPARLLMLTALAVILQFIVGACATRTCRDGVPSCTTNEPSGSSVVRVEPAPGATAVVMNVPGPHGEPTAVVWIQEAQDDATGARR